MTTKLIRCANGITVLKRKTVDVAEDSTMFFNLDDESTPELSYARSKSRNKSTNSRRCFAAAICSSNGVLLQQCRRSLKICIHCLQYQPLLETCFFRIRTLPIHHIFLAARLLNVCRMRMRRIRFQQF